MRPGLTLYVPLGRQLYCRPNVVHHKRKRAALASRPVTRRLRPLLLHGLFDLRFHGFEVEARSPRLSAHSLAQLFRCDPSSSFLMSSGDNFGRSSLSVSFTSLPVKAKGT